MVFKKGCIPWNKGLTKETDERVRKYSKPRSEETKKKKSLAMLKRKEKLGYINSPETRKKIGLANKGKKLSKEAKRKIGLANLGDKNPSKRPEVRKKISKANKGIHFSPKTEFKKGHKRSKFSEEKRIKTRRNNGWWKNTKQTRKRLSERSKGEKNPSWRGGISFEPYSIEFNEELKEKIRKRDNHRCQECFKHHDELFTKNGRRYKLIIHHIDYNKKNNNPNNLISLCRNCHVKTNFKRKDWIKHFQNKMKTFK